MAIEHSRGFTRGDKVQQVMPIGMGSILMGPVFVQDVTTEGELILAKDQLEGPSLTDGTGQPKKYPSRAFRRFFV